MFKLIRQSVLSTLCLAVLLCAAYPMLVTGAADAFFPKEAAGSLILRDGAIVGSALIGQPFSSAKYFHPRPSAAGYNAGSSSGSNYGPTSKALAERVRASEQELRAERPEGVLPVDMLTASGSGLDPHISPDAALMQVRRALAPADNADITMIDGYGYHLPDKMKTRKNGTDAKGGYTVFVGVQG